jgi:hypothetical protein
VQPHENECAGWWPGSSVAASQAGSRGLTDTHRHTVECETKGQPWFLHNIINFRFATCCWVMGCSGAWWWWRRQHPGCW